MLNTFLNVAYVLIAIAMAVLILLQRGAGAAAGSGFGGGASATVFGARGSANFLSKTTAILATLFFLLSLGMAMLASHRANEVPSALDLGVMGQTQEIPVAEPAAVAPPVNSELPLAEPPAPNDEAAAEALVEVPVEAPAAAQESAPADKE